MLLRFLVSLALISISAPSTFGAEIVFQSDYPQLSFLSTACPSYSLSGEIDGVFLQTRTALNGIDDSIRRFDLTGTQIWARSHRSNAGVKTRDIFQYVDSSHQSRYVVSARAGSSGSLFRFAVERFAPDIPTDSTSAILASDSQSFYFLEFIDPASVELTSYVDMSITESRRIRVGMRHVRRENSPGYDTEFQSDWMVYCDPTGAILPSSRKVEFFSPYQFVSQPSSLEISCIKGYRRFSNPPWENFMSAGITIRATSGTILLQKWTDKFNVNDAWVLPEEAANLGDDLLTLTVGVDPAGIHGSGAYLARYKMNEGGWNEIYYHAASPTFYYLDRIEKKFLWLDNTEVQSVDIQSGSRSQEIPVAIGYSYAKFFQPYGTSSHRLHLLTISNKTVTIYDLSTKTDVGDESLPIPHSITLHQNYPNPFNPTTRLDFVIESPEQISLEIVNVLGQNIRTLANQRFAAGRHTIEWDGKNREGNLVSSGVYFSVLKSGDQTQSRKMLLLK